MLLVPNLKFFFFRTKLNVKTNSSTQTNMTIGFFNSSPKIENSVIFGFKFEDFYFLLQTLKQEKFEVADCKHGNGFSILLPKNPNKVFLVPNLRILIFTWNSFSIFQPKDSNRPFWSQVYFFRFGLKFAISQIWGFD